MLPGHCTNGLLCPLTVLGFTSWHDRQSCPLELSRTRKFFEIASTICECGVWQLVHSTLLLTNFTAPVESAVVWLEAKDCTRSGASTIGVFRLNGCEPCRSVPNLSAGYIFPDICICPKGCVCPTATVPSWQLRQRLLSPPSIGCSPVLCRVVLE